MAKTPCALWNPLDQTNGSRWTEIPDTDGKISFVTLAEDPETGHYTRLTRFKPGADTRHHGSQSHDYVEEIYIIDGEIHDAAFDRILTAGDYTCRPPNEKHGPFTSSKGCLVMEVSYPEIPAE